MRRACVLFHVRLMMSLAFLLAAPALAQYGASLQGTVSDKSGALVGGAKVTATNQATGVSRDTVTSGSGFYRIAGLTPGQYKVDVEAASFKKETTAEVEVAAEATR